MAQDDFEAREMHDGATVVHRDKRITRGMTVLFALVGLLPFGLAVLLPFVNAHGTRPMPAAMLVVSVALCAALGAFLWFMAILFAVIRTVVTAQAVHVKYGLWGPTIPLEAITSCRIVDYDWTEFGGWGLRRGRNNATAFVPSNGPCVEIVYEDAKGAQARVLVGAQNPLATANEINRAREAGATRVRVAAESARLEAELEAAADAELARQSERTIGR